MKKRKKIITRNTKNKTVIVKRKKTKRKINIYAKIDWEKASKLFQRSITVSKKSHYPLVKDILHTLAAVSTIGLVFAFPGAAPALGLLSFGTDSYDRWRTKKIISQLSKQKFITVNENDDNTVTVKITKNGMERALTYELDAMKMNKSGKWDHKWRVVMFDIPDKYKRIRDIFRRRLIQLGLFQLQESAYVSPYPCFEEIEFLRELYGIPFTTQYLLVEKIEHDIMLKEHFELV